jgi:hypothetical protein
MSAFDPNSTDAMFAKVLAKLEEQATMLAEIRENGRLTEIEIANLKSWRDTFEGKVTVIAASTSFVIGLVVSAIVSWLRK